jgi:hypothetical protein
MGRRSRKRATTDVRPPAARDASAPAAPRAPAQRAPAPPRAPTWRARMDEAPKAVWSPFPLTELCILLSLVLITIGFLAGGDRRGVLLAGGFALVTLAAGELAVREHFAGYRSHSGLLAGICAILAALPVWLLPISQIVVLAVGVAVFFLAFVQLRRAFVRHSGGVGFRA